MQSKNSLYCSTVTFLLVIFMGYTLLDYYNDLPLEHDQNTIYIASSGGDPKSFMKSLKSSNIKLNLADRALLYFIAPPPGGWYDLDAKKHERLDFFLDFNAHRSKTMNIVVYGGDNNDELFEKLANDMKLDKEKFQQYYRKYSRFLEGEILAGRYTVAQNAGEYELIRYLLMKSRKQLDFFAKEQFGSAYTRKQLHEAIITASIIHKETYKPEEMGTIASVIHNRLKRGMKLQMDGTLNYGKYSHQVITPERIRSDTSRFNTYKYRGLPPYPLCAVTIDSLYAATFPRESDYLYFMKNRRGHHDFAVTLKEHRKNIKNYRKGVKLTSKERREVLKRQKLAEIDAKKGSDSKKKNEPIYLDIMDDPVNFGNIDIAEVSNKNSRPVKMNFDLPENKKDTHKSELSIFKF